MRLVLFQVSYSAFKGIYQIKWSSIQFKIYFGFEDNLIWKPAFKKTLISKQFLYLHCMWWTAFAQSSKPFPDSFMTDIIGRTASFGTCTYVPSHRLVLHSPGLTPLEFVRASWSLTCKAHMHYWSTACVACLTANLIQGQSLKPSTLVCSLPYVIPVPAFALIHMATSVHARAHNTRTT